LPNAPRGRLRIAAICSLILLALAPAAARADGLPADWHRGASLTSWRALDYETPLAGESLEALKATGSDSVSVMTTWYMDDPTSTTIAPAANSPTDEGVRRSLVRAKELGFRVSMKPHIGVKTNTWSAAIRPADKEAWFESFRAYLFHYADMAEAVDADMLVLGTELASMMRYESQWDAIVTELRARFSGELTYAAAGVEEAEKVRLWERLDYVGVDAYMPLSDELDPTVDQLVQAWHERGYVRRLKALAERWNKPLLFTELGYYPHLGTVGQPSVVRWDMPTSWEAQQRAYEAFYRVFSREPWFKGIYWWDWPAVHVYTTDFAPRGLPAERTITDWNATVADPVQEPGGDGETVPTGGRRPRLSARLERGKRRVVVRGAVVKDADCVAGVTVKLRRWRGGGRGWVRVGGELDVTLRRNSYRIVRPLTPGAYRMKIVAASRCGDAVARNLAFRTRGYRGDLAARSATSRSRAQ
jgi:hypothetical protein